MNEQSRKVEGYKVFSQAGSKHIKIANDHHCLRSLTVH